MNIALGIPHTPWVKERAESMDRVRNAIGTWDGPYQEFTERASNKVWPRKMWQWGLDVLKEPTDWFLTIQDDTLQPPYFRRALEAMLPHVGTNAILGLSATHEIGREVARQGHRWYRTRSWVIGWAYAMRRVDLAEFCAWFDAHPDVVAVTNEDDLINRWVLATERSTWHPTPTIIDHDTSIDSSYANDHHVHRRASVTWRDYGQGSLTDTNFWLPSGEPPLLPMPAPRHCWLCLQRPSVAASHLTGAAICKTCLGQIVGTLLEKVQVGQ